MTAIRVLLVDDHKLFRSGMRALLRTLDGIEAVAEAADGCEAVRLIAAQCPDVILMDIMMPNLNGLDAAAQIVHSFPHARVVMLSMNADEDSVLKALRAGAVGYLVKATHPAELELAVRAAARGERFLSSAVSEHIGAACLKRVDTEQSSIERLPLRQREVLQLIAEGYTTKEIATKLVISAKTAEAYRAELMRTLNIHDIASLTRYAIRTGLVSVES